MLIYKQARFYLGNISFQLPENCTLRNPLDSLTDEGLTFSDLEENIYVYINGVNSKTGAKEELKSVIFDMCHGEPCSIDTVDLDGKTGYTATYSSSEYEYYEFWIDLNEQVEGEFECPNTFRVIVETDRSYGIAKAMEQPLVTQFLQSLSAS